jgi:eukaryotic-like serine/threonine-protein kinase
MPLSVGGMGEIFLARLEGAQGFEKLCVIKKILPHLAQDENFVGRFVNEARILVKLTHGSIAQVLDMGLHGGEPYLALEYIDGKDLRKVAARSRERGMPLPLTFVLFVMSRVLDALAYAHRKRDDDEHEIGLVHRDMSPQNILISYEGEVKVIDFGLAKSTLSAAKTNPSIVLGKFLYMSPEQARHQRVDRRSDLYSVGLCLYELIAGKNPFEDVPPHGVMAAVANPSIPHVQQVEPLCPSNIAQIIMRALSVDPDKRFQTAEELRGKLLSCLLEIDAGAGPESCTRFMRETFASEYATERKLLQSMKDSVRSEASSPPVRSLRPRIEEHSGEEATPVPTNLKKYGMEPTRTRALTPAPLSFAPTPKAGESRTPAGERETSPGILFEPNPELTLPGSTGEPERPTSPHLVQGTVRGDMVSEIPTRPVLMNLPPGARPTSPGVLPPPIGLEPMTSQIEIGPPSPTSENLPSVMVETVDDSASAEEDTAPPQPAPAALRQQARPQVLVPAAQVRAPQVVAPLPKALQGKSRPDDGVITDRGTRRAPSQGVMVVLVPLFAALGLAAFVGWQLWQQKLESDAADAEMRTNSSRKMGAPVGADTAARALPQNEPPPDEPSDEVPDLPQKKEAPAAAPKKKAAAKALSPPAQCLDNVQRAFARKENQLEQHLSNEMRMKLEAMEGQLNNGLPPANEALFLKQCNALLERIQRAK